jgi:sn-glycerol 3-phosphate transport system ATP-binding protein
MTLGDKLMVLNDGYVEQFGSPIELYERPATLFVAGFIGSPAMNFIDCELESTDRVRLANGTSLSINRVKDGSSGAATLGIRPEHMVLSDDGELKVEVLLLEHLGAHTLVHGTLQGTGQAIVASLPGTQEVDAGTMLGFNLPAQATHLFDTDSGHRLNIN